MTKVVRVDFAQNGAEGGGGGVLEVALSARHRAMLDQMAADGGYADSAQCAASIIAAVLDDDNLTHDRS